MYTCYEFMLQVLMSSSESSGLSEEHDPVAIVSDDEVAPEPEIFTSDSESDPKILSDDDDFQPFALPDFGEDIPIIDDVLAFPLPIHDQLIIGHPDGGHLDHPEGDQGDGEVEDVVILDIPSPVISVIDISSDSDLHSVADSFECVTSSALHVAGVRAYPTDLDDDDAMSATPSSPVRATTPPPVHDHIPDLVSAPLDLPPLHHPSHNLHLLFLFPLFQGVLSHPLLPTRTVLIFPLSFSMRYQFPALGGYFWSTTESVQSVTQMVSPYSMPIFDPYHPYHHVGYTRDDLLFSLQLQFEILSRRVLDLEFGESARQPPLPSYPPHVLPPPPSIPPLVFHQLLPLLLRASTPVF
ncbi:hypothetical protein Hanom_Chr09g00788761 [Helianthus anomalus]